MRLARGYASAAAVVAAGSRVATRTEESLLYRRRRGERNNEYCAGLLVIPLKASVWSNLCCPARASNSQLAGTRFARAPPAVSPPPRRLVSSRSRRRRPFASPLTRPPPLRPAVEDLIRRKSFCRAENPFVLFISVDENSFSTEAINPKESERQSERVWMCARARARPRSRVYMNGIERDWRRVLILLAPRINL